ncbi:MAG: response regulator [Planctomycetaceae bacterium]|nr:response regulator [Planctomycetales bacterium]MCB9924443.1 response regulator [Planctomycetaceae bacterium]
MLVLSRRPNEKVVFPNLGISVEVLRVAGQAVRLGISAPPEIRILREEVADAESELEGIPLLLSRKIRHDLRNRLNTASLGLQVLHRRLELGERQDLEPTILKVLSELQAVDMELQSDGASGNAPTSKRNRRALIVEDNANESELLATFLRMNGYEVDTVDDGLKALSYLKEHERPDAVLLDMSMPRLDGPKTVTSIRCETKWQGLKLFAVSGADRRDLGVRLGPRGVDRWFAKPVNATQLVREINRELDGALVTA